MLRRVALAFKQSPCRFIPSSPFLTSVCALATASKLPPPQNPPTLDEKRVAPPKLPPHQALLKLFLTVSQNAARSRQIRMSPVLREYFMDPEKISHLLYDLASSANPRRALHAINLSRQLGRELGMGAYEVVAYRLGALKEWDLLLDVIRSGKHNTRQTTPALLDWRARALLETQNYTELYAIFDLFEANNFVPSRRTWHLVLSGYIRNHDLAGARQCLREMETAGIPPNHSTQALIATLYQNIGPDEHVKERGIESLPHILPRAATYMMNSLMNLRLKIYDIDEVFHLLSAYEQSKVGPFALMLAAANAQDPTTIDKHRGSFLVTVEPDAITFAMFIDFFAHLHDLPRCLMVVEQMRLAGIQPTSRIVTSLMRAYFLCGQGGAAVRLLVGMCDPTTTSPEVLNSFPSTEGHTVPFETTGLGPPTRQVFNYFLRGVLGTHGFQGARAVLRLMRANRVRPDSQTSQIITSHTSRIGHAQPRVLMRMVRKLSRRFTLQEAHVIIASTMRYQKFLVDGIGWNTIAAKFSDRRSTKDAKPVPQDAISIVGPDFDPLAGLVLPRRARLRGTFRPIHLSLAERGIKSDRATIALRMRHDAVIKGDMDSATAVFQEMLARGLHANRYHYSALMEGFAKAGNMDAAVDVMRAAANASFAPDALMFTILIVGYTRRKDPDSALRVFQRMVSAGIKPDVPAIDAVSSAFFSVGAYDMCWRVLTTLWPHISSLPPDINKTSLKSAVTYFRSLHRGPQQAVQKTSQEYRVKLYEQLGRLTGEWRQWQKTYRRTQELEGPPRLRSRPQTARGAR